VIAAPALARAARTSRSRRKRSIRTADRRDDEVATTQAGCVRSDILDNAEILMSGDEIGIARRPSPVLTGKHFFVGAVEADAQHAHENAAPAGYIVE
jgi:hypothetical protein